MEIVSFDTTPKFDNRLQYIMRNCINRFYVPSNIKIHWSKLEFWKEFLPMYNSVICIGTKVMHVFKY